MIDCLDKLELGGRLSKEEWISLIDTESEDFETDLFLRARRTVEKNYGRMIFLRGLIEISNHCQNNCYYCGIRAGNRNATRYRLTHEQILACCAEGYELGLRTFVLQGGEDPVLTDEYLVPLVAVIKGQYPDCAVTLSLGERSAESYANLRAAGADRYLLRHETANAEHYRRLHPANLSLEHRMQCLQTLKELGFQTGAGFMIGSPGQTVDCLADDLIFLGNFQPQMVGIGPFLPHSQTPFAKEAPGSARQTLRMLALVRLLLPNALLPATTALSTAADNGWEKGVLAGANVIMPSLTPSDIRQHYLLYDNKNATSAKEYTAIRARMAKIGYEISNARGDFRPPAHT